jgi:hypothetical protein
MGGVMKWVVAGLKAPSSTAPSWGMTVVIVAMNGMGVIHLVYVVNFPVYLYMIPMVMALSIY